MILLDPGNSRGGNAPPAPPLAQALILTSYYTDVIKEKDVPRFLHEGNEDLDNHKF